MGCCSSNNKPVFTLKQNSVSPCNTIPIPTLVVDCEINSIPNEKSLFGISLPSDCFRKYSNSSLNTSKTQSTVDIAYDIQSVSSDDTEHNVPKKNSFQDSKLILSTDKFIEYLNNEATLSNVNIKYLNHNYIKIDTVIDSGSTSDVYIGYLTMLNNIVIKVAIKKINKKYASKKNLIHQIVTEIIALSIINHKYIIKLYGICITDTDILIIMEHCDNGNIRHFCSKSTPINETFLKFYIVETIIGLHYLHSIGIIHRDIKEDNLLIGNDGHIRITDFGCSKIFNNNIPGVERLTTSYKGTPLYMSPYVKYGKKYSFDVDWYSLGVTMSKLTNISSLTYTIQLKQLIEYLMSQNPKYSNIITHYWFSDIDWLKFRCGKIQLSINSLVVDRSSVLTDTPKKMISIKYRRNSL